MAYKWVGTNVPSLTAGNKVSGKTIYGPDFKLPGMLEGKILRSPHAHARIKNIDISKAQRLPGVKSVVTAKDCPPHNFAVMGQRIEDMSILAREKVVMVGDEVAAVAAVDSDTALEAIELIDVEYEELPALFDPKSALAEDAPLIHEYLGSNIAEELSFSHGDPERAFDAADAVVECHFDTSRQYHAFLEPQSVVARWNGDYLTMWLPIQTPSSARMVYAKALGINGKNLRIVQLSIGGGFGGKLEHKMHPVCALLAKKTNNRAVRIVYTRREDMLSSKTRMPISFDVRLAGNKDGYITAKDWRFIADNGAYTYYAIPILGAAITRHDSLYRFKNLKAEAKLVYTNNVPTDAFRGFGNPQSHFACESAIDMLAEKLSIDPLEFRLRNATQKGDLSIHGWQIDSCGFDECLKKSAAAVNWSNRKKIKWSGVGIAGCLHVSGNRSFVPQFDGSSATIILDPYLGVKVYPSETDLGQGLRTTFAQITAEELGIEPGSIEIKRVDTDMSPHGLGTYADRATTLGGNAIRLAAIDVRKQLLQHAANKLECSPEDLEYGQIVKHKTDSDKQIALGEVAKEACFSKSGGVITGIGDYEVPNVSMVDPKTKYGNVSSAYPFAAQAFEVEVNPLTGDIQILKAGAGHDVGFAINPISVEGQIEGSIIMGIGYALKERIVTSREGVENPSFRSYEVPRIEDCIPIESIIVETNAPYGPYGAKGVGEPALNATAPAILNAVYDATGIRFTKLPLFKEDVRKAIKEKYGDLKDI